MAALAGCARVARCRRIAAGAATPLHPLPEQGLPPFRAAHLPRACLASRRHGRDAPTPPAASGAPPHVAPPPRFACSCSAHMSATPPASACSALRLQLRLSRTHSLSSLHALRPSQCCRVRQCPSSTPVPVSQPRRFITFAVPVAAGAESGGSVCSSPSLKLLLEPAPPSARPHRPSALPTEPWAAHLPWATGGGRIAARCFNQQVNGLEAPEVAVGSLLPPEVLTATDAAKPPPFVIEPDKAAVLLEAANGDVDHMLLSLVPPAQQLSRPPVSRFRVACAGLGESGRIFLGVNLEFPGLPLQNSVHAEQFLVTNAFVHGEAGIRVLAVSHAPCGHCRQFLGELATAAGLRILVAGSAPATLPQLLPERFGPHDLLAGTGVPLLLQPRCNGLRTDPAADEAELVAAALAAAQRSYSPYTHSPSGVALRTRSGALFQGAYIECAAYNPSLPPLQAALIAYVAQGGGDYSDITSAAIVEVDGAPVSYGPTTALALERIAPQAQFVAVLAAASAVAAPS